MSDSERNPVVSFAEQLTPTASRLRQRESSVRPVSQVLITLHGKDPKKVFDDARQCVLSWMKVRAGRPLPDNAWNGESFELEEVGSQRAAAIAIDTPRYWAARLDDADRTVPQRVWVAEVGIAECADRTVTFGARLACVTRGDAAPFERSVPSFVRQIVEGLEASLDRRPIAMEPWLVATNDDVDDLVALISNPNRRCDTIVFALLDHSNDQAETAASPQNVHRRTYGAAHVAVITGPASFRLSDLVGREFSVYRQAVRTYRPGFDPAIDHPFRHPLGFPQSIAVWDNTGPEAYERLLVSQALIRTVSSIDIEQQLPPFSSVKRLAGQLRIEAARDTGSSERDLLTLAEEEVLSLRKALDEEKETNLGLLDLAETERDEAQRAEQDARAGQHRLTTRVRLLEKQLAERGDRSEVDIPSTFDGLKEWADRHLSGSVMLLPRALVGAKKSEFEDIPLVYKSLLLLRDCYVPMKREGGIELMRAYEQRCQKLGIEEGPSFAGPGWGQYEDEYVVSYGGRRRRLDRHLKNGNSRTPRYCLRVYFFWDDDDEQVVIGWLPSHLSTNIT